MGSARAGNQRDMFLTFYLKVISDLRPDFLGGFLHTSAQSNQILHGDQTGLKESF